MKQLPSIWKTDLKSCFSLFGLCLNDPRLRGLGSQDQWPEAMDTWYPLGSIPIPKKDWTPRPYPEDKPLVPVSPLLRWDDDDKRETVSNTKVSKWQTFSNKTLCRSCELSFKVVGYSERWLWGMVCWSPLFRCHCPMMITRWSQRDSFLEKHPSIWGHH